ncbi:MAG: GNAT family N-acetyltransferase [Legionellaceae bacterium]|nr:GNAT family N-acetyltransferase [Legionellaceae bacterium]
MKSIIIDTKHLHLRLLRHDDLNHIAKLHGDPEVRRFFPDGTQNIEQTNARMDSLIAFYQEQGLPNFVMFLKESMEFVGRCGFGSIETGEVEVGYLLHKKFWGKGYASEVLAALLEWSKNNIKRDYIIAFAPIDHVASHRVMQKCGMQIYKKDIGHGVMCHFYRMKF